MEEVKYHKDSQKKWRENNREKIKEINKNYREKNKINYIKKITKKIYLCNFCNKEFEDYICNNRKYCSKRCSDKSEERKENVSVTRNKLLKNGLIPPMLGKHHSEKTREKLKVIREGKTYEELFGKENAEELKEKKRRNMIGKNKGNKYSEESKLKMRKPKSKEHKIKISAFRQGIPLDKWKGFTHFEPYTPEFNQAFKLVIKQRDGFLCLKCGMREEDSLILFKKRLHIHHIDYNKKLSLPQNCCALCLRCNIEVNSNRSSWTKFLQSLLSERYGYNYSENGDIILNLENNYETNLYKMQKKL